MGYGKLLAMGMKIKKKDGRKMIEIKYVEKEFFRYFGGNRKNYSINFIDEKENFIGCDLNYVFDDYCIFLVSTDVARRYKEVYYELHSLEEEKRYEEILENSVITIDNYLLLEEKLKNVNILNGNINEFQDGVCYFELTNNMSILFMNSESDEFTKEMYSCYNDVSTVFNKKENKKKV